MSALRSLMAAEATPGRPLPAPETLFNVHHLVACDVLGVVYTDLDGRIHDHVRVAPTTCGQFSAQLGLTEADRDHVGGGPFYLGPMRWRDHPLKAAHCGNDISTGDAMALGFRNGRHHIAQYYFVRSARLFSETELQLLQLLSPVFQRLVRERPTPGLPADLTLAERRVLSHVAAGRSNAEIAGSMCIAVGTVRKHLEHAYRKLGVTNRLAAIARLRGSDEPGLDLQERIDRYA